MDHRYVLLGKMRERLPRDKGIKKVYIPVEKATTVAFRPFFLPPMVKRTVIQNVLVYELKQLFLSVTLPLHEAFYFCFVYP